MRALVLLCFTAVAPWSVLGLISYPSCRELLRRRAVSDGAETLCTYVAISAEGLKEVGGQSHPGAGGNRLQRQRLKGPDKLGFQVQFRGASNRLHLLCLKRGRKPRKQLVRDHGHRWRHSSPAPKRQPKEAQLTPCRWTEAISKRASRANKKKGIKSSIDLQWANVTGSG